MATMPTLAVEYSSTSVGEVNVIGKIVPSSHELWWIYITVRTGPFMDYRAIDIQVGPNPELMWPVLALVTFLVFKGVRTVAKLKRRRAAQEN